MKNSYLLLLCFLCIVKTPKGLTAQEINLELVADGFEKSVDLQSPQDGRLYIVEQTGKIWHISTSGEQKTLFLDIGQKVSTTQGEQGLLGMAFHPDYLDNGYLYVNYTDLNGHTVVARYTRLDTDRADPESEVIILRQDQPFGNHNGGCLAFGPDNYLYIGLGDGGARDDIQNNSQNPMSLLGKILRIDVDTEQGYAIPPSNPFADDDFTADEIWALGLRNPWRFSFDRKTGDLWIGDVGQDQVEEIDMQEASSTGGENYGWRCKEGTHPYLTEGCQDLDSFIDPVYQYPLTDGNCSIIGGYVYRTDSLASLYGHYIFADFCSKNVWKLVYQNDEWQSTLILRMNNNPSSFGQGADGTIYIVSLQGKIYKLEEVISSVEQDELQRPIYPNPTRDIVHFDLGGAQSGILQLIDLYGRIVYRQSFYQQSALVLEMSRFEPQIYYYTIILPKKHIAGQLIKH